MRKDETGVRRPRSVFGCVNAGWAPGWERSAGTRRVLDKVKGRVQRSISSPACAWRTIYHSKPHDQCEPTSPSAGYPPKPSKGGEFDPGPCRTAQPSFHRPRHTKTPIIIQKIHKIHRSRSSSSARPPAPPSQRAGARHYIKRMLSRTDRGRAAPVPWRTPERASIKQGASQKITVWTSDRRVSNPRP